jgi:hypothetical protein
VTRLSTMIRSPPYIQPNGTNSIADRVFFNPFVSPETSGTFPWRRPELGRSNGHSNARSCNRYSPPADKWEGCVEAGCARVLGTQVDGSDLLFGFPMLGTGIRAGLADSRDGVPAAVSWPSRGALGGSKPRASSGWRARQRAVQLVASARRRRSGSTPEPAGMLRLSIGLSASSRCSTTCAEHSALLPDRPPTRRVHATLFWSRAIRQRPSGCSTTTIRRAQWHPRGRTRSPLPVSKKATPAVAFGTKT